MVETDLEVSVDLDVQAFGIEDSDEHVLLVAVPANWREETVQDLHDALDEQFEEANLLVVHGTIEHYEAIEMVQVHKDGIEIDDDIEEP
jgi:hypothetical protein